MFELKNKIVLVLGGRGFLGRSFCQSLSGQGATVISADLAKESKAASTSVFKEELKKIDQLDVDVTNKDSVGSAMDTEDDSCHSDEEEIKNTDKESDEKEEGYQDGDAYKKMKKNIHC